jgi:uncharacterized protein (DUF1330 family)
MPKGYWIARVDVRNEEGYKPYVTANAAIFKKFGARFVVRGGKFECPEGLSRSRNLVIEFPDYATALACYRSPDSAEYQGAAAAFERRHPHHRGLRRPAAVTLVIPGNAGRGDRVHAAPLYRPA